MHVGRTCMSSFCLHVWSCLEAILLATNMIRFWCFSSAYSSLTTRLLENKISFHDARFGRREEKPCREKWPEIGYDFVDLIEYHPDHLWLYLPTWLIIVPYAFLAVEIQIPRTTRIMRRDGVGSKWAGLRLVWLL